MSEQAKKLSVKDILKPALSLFLFCLVVTALLAGTNLLTKDKIAEQERLTTRQRQEEGIAVAKERGKHLGRPKAEFPSDWEETYKSWKQGELTAVAAMKHLGLKRSTFYNLVKLQEGRK